MRGATGQGIRQRHHRRNFNPRSPCGERLQYILVFWESFDYFNPRSPCGERHVSPWLEEYPDGTISIHAPRAGSDMIQKKRRKKWQNFNPRSPCGERRVPAICCLSRARNFNPRSPCGERLLFFSTVLVQILFQSTLPVRGATAR